MLALWLSWAFFSKAFVDYDTVTLTGPRSGLALPERADVKLRGMIVGVVRNVRVENDRVVMTLGMDPQLIGRVPRDVRAEIIPKTLFGEKYISLVPTGSGATEPLRVGDTITDAVVPVEFEKFFNDVYPLLTAVPPERIAYTLTALANSLEGRGDALGQTLEESNAFLKKLNPENKQAIDDMVALGQVSGTYSRQMDEFGDLLRNSAELSETVTDKESELADFFKEGDRLGDDLHDLVDASGGDIIATAGNSVRPLEVGAEYSTMFPCLFEGMEALADKTDVVLKNETIHGAMTIANPQPTRYGRPQDPQPERPIIPKESTLEELDFNQPEVRGYRRNPADADNPFPAGLGTICDELYAAADGNPRSPDEPLFIPTDFWKMFGVKNSHNGKLGTDADYNRALALDATWGLLLGPSLW
jgi:phospholipid/cholesterol/gamma-HCH transport system substrate-binding protein